MRKARLAIPFLMLALISPASVVVLASQNPAAARLYVPPSMAGRPLAGPPSGIACPTTDCSSNWSGYAITGSNGSVSAVYGSWIVPQVVCPSKGATYSVLWVGIDGYNSSTVEQAGTDSDCSNGTPTYGAWYEFYPSPTVPIASVTVAPGDTITASVTYSGVTGNFTASISSSGGGSNSTSQQAPGAQRNSAEWIVERPEICSGNGPDSVCSFTALADFGTAGFGFDYTRSKDSNYATVAGTTGPIGAFFSALAVTMTRESGSVLALPSPLTTDGKSFLVSDSGTFVDVECTPTSVVVGSSVSCKATVAGASPTGKVTWSTNGSGKFSATSCELSKDACSVKYTPASAVSLEAIVATHRSDSLGPSSFGTFGLGVIKMAPEISVSCTSTSVTIGHSVTCTATLKDYFGSPTGLKVAWSKVGSGGGVTFSSSRCTLSSKGACSVRVTGTEAGSVAIRVASGGDQNNMSTSKTVTLKVKQ